MNGESPKIGIQGSNKISTIKDLYEHVSLKLTGWHRDEMMKALNDAIVGSLLCFRRMLIPKDIQMILVRYVRAGTVLALKLEGLLKRNGYLRNLVMKDMEMLDQACRAMYVIADTDDGVLREGKLLQYLIPEGEEADKAAMMSNPKWSDLIGCFRAARWYARNEQYPANGMPFTVWKCWATFDPPVSAPIDLKHQWHVFKDSSFEMLKRVIALPGWDLDESLRACCGENMLKRVTLLLEHGADANAKDVAGWTVLVMASRNGLKQVVELLIKHGADVNATDINGMTALAWATKKGHEKVVEVLIKHEAK